MTEIYKCAARENPSSGGILQDCGRPGCGCDPHVERVAEGLEEQGFIIAPPETFPPGEILDKPNANAFRQAMEADGFIFQYWQFQIALDGWVKVLRISATAVTELEKVKAITDWVYKNRFIIPDAFQRCAQPPIDEDEQKMKEPTNPEGKTHDFKSALDDLENQIINESQEEVTIDGYLSPKTIFAIRAAMEIAIAHPTPPEGVMSAEDKITKAEQDFLALPVQSAKSFAFALFNTSGPSIELWEKMITTRDVQIQLSQDKGEGKELLSLVRNKDFGRHLCSMGVKFGLIGDEPYDFITEFQEFYLSAPQAPDEQWNKKMADWPEPLPKDTRIARNGERQVTYNGVTWFGKPEQPTTKES